MKRWLFAALVATAVQCAQAQDAYPSKPVRILSGFPAGTSTDIIGRIYAQKLSDHFKRPFVVENRLGVAGNLAAQAAAKSPADGYTLLVATVANAISASVYRNLGYEFADDLVPVARLANAPNVLVVSPKLGVSSVREFIALAKSQPGKLFYGSAGVGTAPHLSGELFNLMTDAKLMHVPYKGNAQGLVDLAEGRLSTIFAPAPTVAAFLKDGRVKALATTAEKRASFLPDLPTMVESGLPGFDTAIWYGLVVPKGTPQPIIGALADIVLRATEAQDVRAQLAANGADPLPAGPEEFGRFIRDDVKKWAKVVEFAKITPE